MSRADVHSAFVLDREILEASAVDPSLLDPVIRLEGGVPGTSKRLAVVRVYQGPQGSYVEEFVIRDPKGRELVRSRPKRISLSGEMFEDRFVDYIDGIHVTSGAEHSATFYVDDEEAGTIPVFVELSLGGDPRLALQEAFAQALKKGTIAWITVPQPKGDPRTVPFWFVFTDGKVYLLSGPSEQQIPNLEHAREVELTVRSKDVGSRISTIPASVRIIPPSDPEFDRIARMGLGKRLNLPDGDGALERWRQQCILAELTPQFDEVSAA